MTLDTITGEVYEAGLTPFEARELTDEIRQTLTLGHDLLIRAYTGRAWTALGYATWDAYCAGEFSEARMVRLDREQRREIVAEMRQAGMSTPAIGAALGVSDETARRDIHAVSTDVEMPERITMTDGRERSSTTIPTRPAASPAALPDAPLAAETRRQPAAGEPKRRALTDAFFDAAFDLTKAVERVTRITEDDRFTRNASQVAAKHRGDLMRAHEALAGVLALLPETGV